MMSHDLYAEMFHREIVKQEEEQKRRKLVQEHQEEVEELQQKLRDAAVEHNNEKIRMIWAQHDDEVTRVNVIFLLACIYLHLLLFSASFFIFAMDKSIIYLISWFMIVSLGGSAPSQYLNGVLSLLRRTAARATQISSCRLVWLSLQVTVAASTACLSFSKAESHGRTPRLY